MLRIALIAIISLAFIIPQSLSASIYGTVKGEVLDENGNPAIGATVQVVETKQGAYVKANGKFAITGVRAGSYSLKVSYAGYEPIIKKINVSADQTTDVDYKLQTFTSEEILVVDDKMVEKTQVGSISKFNKDDLERTASGGVTSIVTQSSGVVNSGNGYNIRGTRANDTQVLVDGLDVGNQFTGGFGGSGTTYAPMVSSYATEEIQVKKGGTGAQQGNSTGGTVNTVVKTGNADKYDGFLAFRTDLPSLNGSQGSGVELIRDGNSFDIIEQGEGRQLEGDNLTNIEFGVGGPIPGLNEALKTATFYLTGRYEFRQNRNSGYEYYAPIVTDFAGNQIMGGENLGQLDNQRSWVKNITGRMSFGLTDNVSVIIGGQLGQTNLESQGLSTYYMRDEGIIDGVSNGIEERFAKLNVSNTDVNNVFLKLTQSFPEASAFYDIRLSANVNNDMTGRRTDPGSDPSFFSGFDILIPTDEYAIDNLTRQLTKGQKDRLPDQYTPILMTRYPNDGSTYAGKEDYNVINPLTGYIESLPLSTYRNPFGTNQFFTGHGSYGFQFRKGTYLQADGNFTKYISGDRFEHNIQAGFELRTYTMGFHSNSSPTTSEVVDVYSSEFGGNIYAESQEVYDLTSSEFTPFRAAAYVQDQISFEGIIITPGMRFDMFDANSIYRTRLFPLVQRGDLDGFTNTTAKIMISPRLNASYPITDQSVFKMNFGVYYQMPQLQFMFDGTNLVTRNIRTPAIGNPNLEPERTNKYEVGYSSALTEDFALDINAYYNDIYNQLGYSYVAAADPYYLAEVGQYGTNKGVEIDLRKRVRDNFGFRLAYTLASVNGTSDGAQSSIGLPRDPITTNPALPLSTFRLDRDITHRLTTVLTFEWGEEEGPAIGGIYFLEDAYATVTGNLRSGAPYTLTEVNGTGQLSEINALEGPASWSIDTRLGKKFALSDLFGEGMGNTSIEFYVDIFNLTNRTEAVNVYGGTQSSLNDGTLNLVQLGSFSPNVYYDQSNPAVPASYNARQYNQFGERIYFISADIDKNGNVTREEQYENYTRTLEEVTYKNKPLFQVPRRIFFGAVIRF
ncbi:MAG: TonB-dependent receptor [Candidatus Kapaibacterium sp.]|nr:TonB-dependent receptor [Ignavibacteriota bacterium]MCB9222054.1 TonB-dependent receptor [Ignavibacteria bacterium]